MTAIQEQRKRPESLPFSPRIKNIHTASREIARNLNHDWAGSPHVFIALLDLAGKEIASALSDAFGLDFNPEKIRKQLVDSLKAGKDSAVKSNISLRHGAKMAFAFAQEEAISNGKKEVGAMHLFIGLVRHRIGERKGMAAGILEQNGIYESDLDTLREHIEEPKYLQGQKVLTG